MYPKILVAALFSILFALAAVATPHPHINERDESSSLSSAKSVFASVTSEVRSGVSDATSLVAGALSTATSGGASVLSRITSGGQGALSTATSLGASVIGDVTSGFGVATSAIGSFQGSGAVVSYGGVQTSLLVGLGSVIVSALLGAMITL